MPDIRYVVLSDLHLGAENSILTRLKPDSIDIDPSAPSQVMIQLVACLKDVILKNNGANKPTLVLNGDLMELALTTTNNACMVFEHFIKLAMPENGEWLFDKKIVFLAGNHDHNLWERSRNNFFVEKLRTFKEGEEIWDEMHTNAMVYPYDVPETLLNMLVQRIPHLKDVTVSSVYPAWAVLSDDKQKAVVFSHGHYVESMYSLMTSLRSKIFPDRKAPTTLRELEKENYAWVDFFWSDLGRSGAVGKDINLIYDKLQDEDQVKLLIHNIAESLTRQKKNFIMRWLEKDLLQELLELTLGKMAASERNEPDVALTPDARAGLKAYIEVFIYSQFKHELNDVAPGELSFIFGHTHKPFQEMIRYKPFKVPVNVYNSGGWVVDTMHKQPLHGGSVILVDEQLDIVSLQMYREGKLEVTLEELKEENAESREFYKRISQLIDMKQEPWSGFSTCVSEAVQLRYANLAEIAKSRN